MIQTDRSYMRPVELVDLPGYFELYQDPEVVKMNADGQTKSEEWVTD